MKRLLLFDIDGTLVRGGPAKPAFELAMESVFGTAGPINGHDFSGKTDPQIARELLRLAGLEDSEIDAGIWRLWEVYLRELETRLAAAPMTVLPGVGPLLQHLVGRDNVMLGLLTGNIVQGARLKLDSVGLGDYFEVGGYGSDSEIRDHLPAIVLGRAEELMRAELPPSSAVVVGDTPRDVACGKYGRMRTVAVTTGRFGWDELTAAEPDHVLPDFSDLQDSLDAILG